MAPIISGIQQVGIGVTDAEEAFSWYKQIFGTDIIIFKDSAPASLMQQYTGNKVHERLAILAMNLQGGGGFELWQFTSRKPSMPQKVVQLGDYGIFSIKIKCRDVTAAYEYFWQQGVNLLSMPAKDPSGLDHFFLQDPWGNTFEIIQNNDWFSFNAHPTGGVCGATIGVSEIDKSVLFYKNVLGYDQCLHRGEGRYEDWQQLSGGRNCFKRVVLGRSGKQQGPFSKLLGTSFIELVEVTDRTATKIYKDRFWGDPGFIHMCFDIHGLSAQEELCNSGGYPMTVNSCNSFDMGNAAGQFCYNEDPDGTLIEYVETHKVPIVKKLGLYLNLKKRNPEKQLPDWMVRCLRFNRVKK